jgi:hypothetical protein
MAALVTYAVSTAGVTPSLTQLKREAAETVGAMEQRTAGSDAGFGALRWNNQFPRRSNRRIPPCQRHAGTAAGSSIVNVLPTPGVLSTETEPPWACTMCFTIESPRPVPPSLRLRALSTR